MTLRRTLLMAIVMVKIQMVRRRTGQGHQMQEASQERS